jgi:hypothetical protein
MKLDWFDSFSVILSLTKYTDSLARTRLLYLVYFICFSYVSVMRIVGVRNCMRVAFTEFLLSAMCVVLSL